MAGVKRSHDGTHGRGLGAATASPFMPMFESFRSELDEHHDRRERIIKAGRDVTALSKKMIFSLQRVQHLRQDVPKNIATENIERRANIAGLFESISDDLRDINGWRYQRQISGGIQEFIEAISFEHYLTTQTLITPEEAGSVLPMGVQLTEGDYVLGIFDLVGELMRFAITTMATSGSLPGKDITRPGDDSGDVNVDMTAGEQPDILTDLRALRTEFETLDMPPTDGLAREVEKKLGVMKTCVEKVELAVYGMIIRGRERPKGWVPDLREDGGGSSEAVESY